MARKSIEYCLQEAIANVQLEGLYPTAEEIEQVRACLSGEMSEEEFLEQLRGVGK